jgi:hypothetical protein
MGKTLAAPRHQHSVGYLWGRRGRQQEDLT